MSLACPTALATLPFLPFLILPPSSPTRVPAHLPACYPAHPLLQAKAWSASTAPMRTSCAPRDELSIESRGGSK
ncbi:uncharacterized protein SCHCODRAFT_02639358 [Schizophyllum commune H4-8]|uniref:uncharacterized protein n=1 Tax=Schizophyllum commune (strain H4-8 / FGSC 9210) TaxID=578458 RepID=UPI00215FB916|nr:uncharacterized protein SCHCODRAFT_02639358 [Schizophyllum commune H4-8]KAI5887963.1 hypothetical protein SCHCODRAFT_02639358 [Schizophyllum commune H4-8]